MQKLRSLIPTLYLAAFVWENRLVVEPSVTRLILVGVILIVLMNARPQGLLGNARVEIVVDVRELLELNGVSKRFGGLTVIDELDLHVDEGEIVSVIGPNGAGKTTLFNLVTGIYPPDAGEHPASTGESLVGLEPHQITPAGSRARSRRCACS